MTDLTTRMSDLSKVTDEYLNILKAGYEKSKSVLPADLAAEIFSRQLSEAVTQAKDAEEKIVQARAFWSYSDLGASTWNMEFGFQKKRPTIDPNVLGIARFQGLSLDDLQMAIQPFDDAWRARRTAGATGRVKAQWIEWLDERPFRIQYHTDVYKLYLNATQTWTSKMQIGTGTTVHLLPDEVPERCLVRVSQGKIIPVIAGSYLWPWNENHNGERAVYGWWT